MGIIQDNNLPADGSKDQDKAIAAGLLAAAKKFYKKKTPFSTRPSTSSSTS
jgi:hypothetical protein